MSRKNIDFEEKNIKKREFYKNKKINNIDAIDINKVLFSKKEPYLTKNLFKYFIGCNNNDVIRPLCIRIPQMTGYAGTFDGNATIFF